eukprot:1013501_1
MYSSEYLWNDLPCDQPTTSTSKEYIESIKDACGVSDFDACLIQEVNTSYELNTTAGTKAIYGSTTTQIVLSNHHACVKLFVRVQKWRCEIAYPGVAHDGSKVTMQWIGIRIIRTWN